ncbi:MAG: hypothetical protein GC185_12905 [Alphaproteobacteria bacterium]|nr:hypothetical protein [Alphaproteobacteria bacterium]
MTGPEDDGKPQKPRGKIDLFVTPLLKKMFDAQDAQNAPPPPGPENEPTTLQDAIEDSPVVQRHSGSFHFIKNVIFVIVAVFAIADFAYDKYADYMGYMRTTAMDFAQRDAMDMQDALDSSPPPMRRSSAKGWRSPSVFLSRITRASPTRNPISPTTAGNALPPT